MRYRRLGQAGVQVSTIGLGSWLTYSSGSSEVGIRCIHRAYELGVNFFDTANEYQYGEAEEVVGKALRGFPRDTYVLATKVYFPMREGPNGGGLSRKHIMEQCHASLRRLGQDYVDLYQCHRYDQNTPLEETLRALDDLVSQGKVLYTGVSEWSAVQITYAVYTQRSLNLDKIVSNQPVYNMLTRYIEKEVIPVCKREGIGQIVYSPLAGGVLTGKYKPGQPPPTGTRGDIPETRMFVDDWMQEQTLSAVQNLQSLAQEAGWTLPQMALAWVLRESNVSSAIMGASRVEQVGSNARAADIVLPADLLQAIDETLGDLISYES
jgi:aryl-alcohol dehydrogenase-like predicted oxidoreductase